MSYTAAMIPSGQVAYHDFVSNFISPVDWLAQMTLIDSMASTCSWSRGSGFHATGVGAVSANPGGDLTGAPFAAGVYDSLQFIVYGPLNIPLIIPSGSGIVAVPGGATGNDTCDNLAAAIQSNTRFNCTYAQVGPINGTGTITLVAKTAGYGSNWTTGNVIPIGGGWDYTSVPTPGLGDTVTLFVTGDNNSVKFKPILGGNSCAVQNPLNSPVHVSFWMNKYGFATIRTPTAVYDNGFAAFFVSALYVPSELRTSSILSTSFFYTGDGTLSSRAKQGGAFVNGVFKTNPWGGTNIFFVQMQMPIIFASPLAGQLLTTRSRPIQQTPFVALALAGDTEAKVAGILTDSFIALSNNEARDALATGPDGRTYRLWGLSNTIGGSALWLATS